MGQRTSVIFLRGAKVLGVSSIRHAYPYEVEMRWAARGLTEEDEPGPWDPAALRAALGELAVELGHPLLELAVPCDATYYADHTLVVDVQARTIKQVPLRWSSFLLWVASVVEPRAPLGLSCTLVTATPAARQAAACGRSPGTSPAARSRRTGARTAPRPRRWSRCR
jgi:hypothetical protein